MADNTTQQNKENQAKAVKQEKNFIEGLRRARAMTQDESVTQTIYVNDNNGDECFHFRIRPLTQDEYIECSKKATHKDKKGREDINLSHRYSEIIYSATVDEDKYIWDSQESLDEVGTIFYRDVITESLPGGYKMQIVDAIDKLSGFDQEDSKVDIVDEAKN